MKLPHNGFFSTASFVIIMAGKKASEGALVIGLMHFQSRCPPLFKTACDYGKPWDKRGNYLTEGSWDKRPVLNYLADR